MDPDFLHLDGYQGVSLSTTTAHHFPQQAHREAHPELRGVLDPLEHRAVSRMDLPMHSSACSLELSRRRDG